MFRGINFQSGINKIYDIEGELQEHCLKELITNVRKITDLELVDKNLADFKSNGMFYVYADDYLEKIYGPEVKSYQAGMYYDEQYCKYYRRLCMPMRDFKGRVIGFIGYNNGQDCPDENFVKYLYPNKTFFDKSRYMYIERDEYARALADQYLCVVDGLFDKRTLELNNVHATSLCGSQVTKWHRHYLSFFKTIVVIPDNDKAGSKLVKDLKNNHPNVRVIKNGRAWDIDDALKSQQNIREFKKLIDEMKYEGFSLDKHF